jgi:trehalose/maltose hydrolase-like predicted phosphorylase
MAGTVDLVQRGQTGLELRGDVLRLNPCLPKELTGLRMRVRYRGHWLEVAVARERLTVTASDGWTGPEMITIRDKVHAFGAGTALDIPCQPEGDGWRPAERGE